MAPSSRRASTDLVELTNADRGFYATLGPFLANRDVVKQVGGPIWDDDTKTWFVLKDSKQGVLGFVAVALHGRRTTVESLYLRDPSWERVARELVGAVVARYGDRPLYAVVRHASAYAYLDAGFEETGTTTEFTKLTREATP